MSDTATAAAPVAKETKAQRAERLKIEKNPWEAWDEVREFARQGRESVLPEWTGLYFKWWGIYTQGDGVGITGGVDEPHPAGRAQQVGHGGEFRRCPGRWCRVGRQGLDQLGSVGAEVFADQLPEVPVAFEGKGQGGTAQPGLLGRREAAHGDDPAGGE